jgi:uncharacterized protein YqjF (DUF2071 family)
VATPDPTRPVVPACHVHFTKNATTRVWWTHEDKKRTALLCDECVAKIADIITDARRLNPEEQTYGDVREAGSVVEDD